MSMKNFKNNKQYSGNHRRGRKQVYKTFLVDVECEWGSLSPFNGRMTEFGVAELDSGETYHGILYNAVQDPDNDVKFTIAEGDQGYDVHEVMHDFKNWIDSFQADRCIFVSDNPAYDYMWIIEAFDRAGVDNPFGHSARRIGDFAAGLERNWKLQSKWKKLRKTQHDHNPVNDALGNREALLELIKISQRR